MLISLKNKKQKTKNKSKMVFKKRKVLILTLSLPDNKDNSKLASPNIIQVKYLQ